MQSFNSGDHQFSLFDFNAKKGSKNSGSNLIFILDVPYTEELSHELESFRWKDVKVELTTIDTNVSINGEFFVDDIDAKAYKEGNRIRIFLIIPYHHEIDILAAKSRWHDIAFDMQIIQKELFEKDEQVS